LAPIQCLQRIAHDQDESLAIITVKTKLAPMGSSPRTTEGGVSFVADPAMVREQQQRCASCRRAAPPSVIPGLEPGIHGRSRRGQPGSWVLGSSPRTTERGVSEANPAMVREQQQRCASCRCPSPPSVIPGPEPGIHRHRRRGRHGSSGQAEDDGGWGELRGKSSDGEAIAAALRLLPPALPGPPASRLLPMSRPTLRHSRP
ncbi:UNVERIFIED_ORG: hypothetical protein GGE55_006256, partial [Rhizobium esperanzae]